MLRNQVEHALYKIRRRSDLIDVRLKEKKRHT